MWLIWRLALPSLQQPLCFHWHQVTRTSLYETGGSPLIKLDRKVNSALQLLAPTRHKGVTRSQLQKLTLFLPVSFLCNFLYKKDKMLCFSLWWISPRPWLKPHLICLLVVLLHQIWHHINIWVTVISWCFILKIDSLLSMCFHTEFPDYVLIKRLSYLVLTFCHGHGKMCL